LTSECNLFERRGFKLRCLAASFRAQLTGVTSRTFHSRWVIQDRMRNRRVDRNPGISLRFVAVDE